MQHSFMIKFYNLRNSLLMNSAFLITNTLSISIAGFLFWILATQQLEPAQIGVGAAYITAITLLSNFGEMGLGITLIRFLPTMTQQTTFVNTTVLTVLASTLILALVFVAGVPLWAPELDELVTSAFYFGLFILSTTVFSVVQVLDKLYIALQTTHFMFLRTLCANLLKVGLVVALGASLGASGLVLAVGMGAFVSLLLSRFLFMPYVLPNDHTQAGMAWSLIRDKIGYSLGNHFSQMLWSAPPLIYPLVIISLLGAEANAYFYTSWMLANVLFIIPMATSTSVFARISNKSDPDQMVLWRVMRLTLLALLPCALLLGMLSPFLLSIFGSAYVSEGKLLLVLLIVSVFPYTLNTFFITHYRSQETMQDLIWVSGLIAFLSLLLILLFGSQKGLIGVGIGWIIGQTVGAIAILLYERYKKAAIGIQTSQKASSIHHHPIFAQSEES